MQIIGRLEEIHDTIQRTQTFSVREFVLEISTPTSQYTEHVLFQLTNQRTGLVDSFKIGDELVVDFDIQGRKWTNPEGNVVFFNRLNAWRINLYNGQQMQGGQAGSFQQQPYGGQPVGGGFQQQPYGGQPMGGGFQQQPYGGQPMGGGMQSQPIGGQPSTDNVSSLSSQQSDPAAPSSDDDLPF